MTASRLMFYVTILVASLTSTSPAQAQETEVIAGGELEYQNHCAICHGVDGKGHGIMAKFLTISPADLTQSQRKMPADFRSGKSIASSMDGRKSAAMGRARCRFGALDFRPKPRAAIPAHAPRQPVGFSDWSFTCSTYRSD
jgi:cytochrome c553